MSLIMENFTGYYGGKRFFALFLLCMAGIIVFFRGSKRQRQVSAYVLLLLLVTFCPLTARLIMAMIGAEVYWRMFWLLPATFAVAYAATLLIGKNKLFAILLVVVLVFSGNNLYLQNRIVAAENVYKIENEVIETVGLIRDDGKEMGRADAPKVCFPSTLYCYVRQYDAGIRMPYGRNAERNTELTAQQRRLYRVMEAEKIDYPRLAKLLRKESCDYVVLAKEKSQESLSAEGLEIVGETEKYVILRAT